MRAGRRRERRRHAALGRRRLHRDGQDEPPSRLSGFAEYATVSRRSCVKVDRELPLDEAALFGCAVLTGVGAVINTAQVPAGTSVAVIGLGGVGLAAVLGAVAAGASRVVAVDLSDEKLGLARQLGATETFNAGAPDAVEEIRAATGRGGVRLRDGGLGAGDGPRLQDHPARGHDGHGRAAAADAYLALPQVNLVAEERTVKGSYIGTCVPMRDMPRYVELYRRASCRSTA